ncbi:MAG: nuclease, partial [Dehalococcoidia bacterium]|nr:nuclease [Dehalococcoidia bacterium]
MRITDGRISFGAGDLVDHLACRYLTELNTRMAEGVLAAPGDRDPMLDLLRQRGLVHEQEYVRHLEESGCKITRIDGVGLSQEGVDETLEAMRSGCEIIVQAALSEGAWGGRADVLRRVDVPSELGDWSYEVIDTKLARKTKCGAILQLSLYSDLVRAIQGVLPEFMHVVAPWTGFVPQSYRTGDYSAYYRLVRTWLETAVFKNGHAANYP